MKPSESMPGVYYNPETGLRRGEFKPREILPWPIPPGCVLLEVKSAGVCASDKHYIDNDPWAQAHGMQGVPLGHEIAGVVIEVGEGLKKRDWGGKYCTVESHAPLFRKDRMRTWGQTPWWDPEVMKRGFSIVGYDARGGDPVSGGWAPYLVVPVHNLYQLSQNALEAVDGHGCVIEPNGNAVYTVFKSIELLAREAQIKPQQAKLAIFGLGPQGRMMAYVARAMGFGKIVGIDIRQDAVQAVERLGIADGVILNQGQDKLGEQIIDSLEGRANIVIDACGASRVIEQSAAVLGKEKGVIIAFGLGDPGRIMPGSISSLGISLGKFVFEQLEFECQLGNTSFTIAGLTGRTPESWEWLVQELNANPRGTLAQIIRGQTVCIGFMDEFARMLPSQNQGESRLPPGKLVMTPWIGF